MHFKLILISLLFSITYFAKSQTFEIVDKVNYSKEVIDKHIKALSISNIENYRAKTVSKTLQFQNGIKFKLHSAKQLFISGQKIDLNNYSDERPLNYSDPIFLLADDGSILTMYKKIEKQ